MPVPSAEAFRTLVAHSPIASLICDLERVHYVSHSGARLFGFVSPEEPVGLAPLEALIGPEDRARFADDLSAVLSGEAAMRIQSVGCRHRDGHLFQAVVRAQPFPEPGGSLIFATFVSLPDAATGLGWMGLLGHAVDAISEAIMVADASLAIIYANRAARDLMGEELIGRDVRSMVSPTATAEQRRPFEELHERGWVSGELPMCGRSGEDFPGQLTVSVVYAPDGSERGRIGIVRDITEAKGMEAERQLRERQLALMLREAHHRIQNNLQVASDVLQLQARSARSEDARKALESAAERLRAMSAVHRWISPDHEVSVIDVRHVIETVVRSLKDTLTATGETLRFGVEIDDAPVESRHATAVALITTELLTNAIRHAAPAAIEVRFAARDGQACLEVTDDGPSGPPLDWRGRGFGLELAELLAEEQLGGSLTLERAPGATVARVVFPYVEPPVP